MLATWVCHQSEWINLDQVQRIVELEDGYELFLVGDMANGISPIEIGSGTPAHAVVANYLLARSGGTRT